MCHTMHNFCLLLFSTLLLRGAMARCSIPAHASLLFPDDCASWECHLGFVRGGFNRSACCPTLEHYCVTECNASGYSVERNCSNTHCTRGTYYNGKQCAKCDTPLPAHAFWYTNCVWACNVPWVRMENYCRSATVELHEPYMTATVFGDTDQCPVAKYERLLSRYYRAQATIISISDGVVTKTCYPNPCPCNLPQNASSPRNALYMVYSYDGARHVNHNALLRSVRNIIEIQEVPPSTDTAPYYTALVTAFVLSFLASSVAVWLRYRKYKPLRMTEPCQDMQDEDVEMQTLQPKPGHVTPKATRRKDMA